MTRASTRGKALLLFLAALLVLPWRLPAAPRRAAPARVTAQEPAPATSLTVQLGSWLRSLWGKEGLNIDPNGRAAARPTGGATIGSNIDPDGLPAADAGLNIDPDG